MEYIDLMRAKDAMAVGGCQRSLYYAEITSGVRDEFVKLRSSSVKARHIVHLENHALVAGLTDEQRRALVERILRPSRVEAWTVDDTLARGLVFIRERAAENRKAAKGDD